MSLRSRLAAMWARLVAFFRGSHVTDPDLHAAAEQRQILAARRAILELQRDQVLRRRHGPPSGTGPRRLDPKRGPQ